MKKIKLELQEINKENQDTFLNHSTKKLLQLMEENVLYGTGKKAFLPGYRIGGKTATAEKIDYTKGDMIKQN